MATLRRTLGARNQAAPPSWVQLSSVLVCILRNMGMGAQIEDPFTREIIHTIGALFVDETDLYVWKEYLRSGAELWPAAQEELAWWGELIITTGGGLKAEKSFSSLLDYECVEGEWQILEHVDLPPLLVPNSDGTWSEINSVSPMDASKTLGTMTSLAGSSAEQLTLSVKWPPPGSYGLGGVSAPTLAWPTLWHRHHDQRPRGCNVSLRRHGLQTAQHSGDSKTVKTGWRCIHTTFGGFGILSFPIEQLICRLNLLLQHYHTGSAISRKLDLSFRLLQLQ